MLAVVDTKEKKDKLEKELEQILQHIISLNSFIAKLEKKEAATSADLEEYKMKYDRLCERLAEKVFELRTQSGKQRKKILP